MPTAQVRNSGPCFAALPTVAWTSSCASVATTSTVSQSTGEMNRCERLSELASLLQHSPMRRLLFDSEARDGNPAETWTTGSVCPSFLNRGASIFVADCSQTSRVLVDFVFTWP